MNSVFQHNPIPYCYNEFKKVPTTLYHGYTKLSDKQPDQSMFCLSSAPQYDAEYSSLDYYLENQSPSSCSSELLGVLYSDEFYFATNSQNTPNLDATSFYDQAYFPMDSLLFSPYHNENEPEMIQNLIPNHSRTSLDYSCTKAPVQHKLYTIGNQEFSPYKQNKSQCIFTSSVISSGYSFIANISHQLEPENMSPLIKKECVQKQPMTEDTFPCTYPNCNKLFSRPYNLKSHMRIHSLEKPYECTYKSCVWKFTRPHDLKRHELQHTGLKPHTCKYCSRKFARSDALKRHWKVDSSCSLAFKNDPSDNKTPGRGRKKGSKGKKNTKY